MRFKNHISISNIINHHHIYTPIVSDTPIILDTLIISATPVVLDTPIILTILRNNQFRALGSLYSPKQRTTDHWFSLFPETTNSGPLVLPILRTTNCRPSVLCILRNNELQTLGSLYSPKQPTADPWLSPLPKPPFARTICIPAQIQ